MIMRMVILNNNICDALKNKIYYEPKTTSKSEQQFKIVYDNLNHKN